MPAERLTLSWVTPLSRVWGDPAQLCLFPLPWPETVTFRLLQVPCLTKSDRLARARGWRGMKMKNMTPLPEEGSPCVAS